MYLSGKCTGKCTGKAPFSVLEKFCTGKFKLFLPKNMLIKRINTYIIKIDNYIYEIDQTPELKKNYKHNIDIIVDRLIVKKEIIQRLSESIELSLNISNGLVCVEDIETKKNSIYSSRTK